MALDNIILIIKCLIKKRKVKRGLTVFPLKILVLHEKIRACANICIIIETKIIWLKMHNSRTWEWLEFINLSENQKLTVIWCHWNLFYILKIYKASVRDIELLQSNTINCNFSIIFIHYCQLLYWSAVKDLQPAWLNIW